MTTTLAKIETLASTLAKRAASDGTSLTELIEAVKVLSPYYAALRKAAGNDDTDPSDGATMATMQNELHRIEESGNGGTVSHRSRRRN